LCCTLLLCTFSSSNCLTCVCWCFVLFNFTAEASNQAVYYNWSVNVWFCMSQSQQVRVSACSVMKTLSISGSVDRRLLASQCQPLKQPECWHAVPREPISAPQLVGVLTCGSLWVNASSLISGSVAMWLLVSQYQLLNQRECWHAALHGSMSAPPMGGLPFNLIVGYCQLLVERCVTYVPACSVLHL